ncbi:phage tail protein [Burkholderia thailandensis]|nr:phage tail protein [Burkholderia thailandensis]
MSVGTAGASATLTADEIIVESALGGAAYKLANFNKTINLATTGAGGMDTGSAPVSGYVALYAIYNPTTGASALLARNATSAVQPNVYGGANMPSGYTASALVSVWPTNGSGQFIVGAQVDRAISIPSVTVLTTSTTQASPTALSISGAVPPNARKVSGTMSVSSTSSTPNSSIIVYAASTGVGIQGLNNSVSASGGISTNYKDLPITVSQTLYYTATSSAGTPTFTMGVASYEF